MTALVPTTNFSSVPSPSRPSSSPLHRTLPSQVHFKPSHMISSSSPSCRHGHVSATVFSGAIVGIPVYSDPVATSFGGYALPSCKVTFFFDNEQQLQTDENRLSMSDLHYTAVAHWFSSCREPPSGLNSCYGCSWTVRSVFRCNCTSRKNQDTASNKESTKDVDEDPPSGGVAIAVKCLQFYKREIFPLLPGSCHFVPTCSEYGMQAFKKYGIVKGAIFTAWHLSRCNPLGGNGFDPPRWFDEPRPPPY